MFFVLFYMTSNFFRIVFFFWIVSFTVSPIYDDFSLPRFFSSQCDKSLYFYYFFLHLMPNTNTYFLTALLFYCFLSLPLCVITFFHRLLFRFTKLFPYTKNVHVKKKRKTAEKYHCSACLDTLIWAHFICFTRLEPPLCT